MRQFDVRGPLKISEHLLDDLLSALRRHHLGDSRHVLGEWAAAGGSLDLDYDWLDEFSYLDDELTGWVHAEASDHIEAGRFEYAAALVERYRPPVTADDMTARITFAGTPQ